MRKNYVRYAAVFSACVLGVSSINVSPVHAQALALSETKQHVDTDKDGMEDYLEECFGTDKTKADTDGDGISDYQEVFVLDTNPLKKDSSIDTDKDGLSNLKEIKLGTSPVKADTDSDGLTDGVEVKKYHSNPLKEDTDKDGIADGDEVLLKLNPIKKASKKNVKDSKRLFKQTLVKQNIESSLRNKSNKAVPSLSGSVPGVLEKKVSIRRSTIVVDKLENARVGEMVEVVSDYKSPVTMKLSFACGKATKSQLKAYRIGQYENGKLTFLKTSVSGTRLTATIKKGGAYLVVNTKAKRLVKPMGFSSFDVDTDYDGIANVNDPTPYDNSFTGVVHNDGFKFNDNVSYAIDYRNFFQPATAFNSQICKVSAIYAQLAYDMTITDNATKKEYSFPDLMRHHGFSNVDECDLSNKTRFGYNDYDLTKFFLGNHDVEYNGRKKTVVVVAIQGTNGGIAQWQSNFDIGSTSKYSSYPDWTTIENHRGFDIAANRVMREMDSYVKKYCANKDVVFWLTGHSRGGAIANIISAKLADQGKTAFGYTFASPNTTTKSNATSYKYNNIFNLVNKDDFVPCLPCIHWNFKRYGRTSIVSLAKNYEKEWEKLTGKWDYNPDTIGMDKTVNSLGELFKTRNDAYIYTCKCHGTGSKNDITIKNRGMSKKSREEAIAKIPFNAAPYGIITRYNGKLCFGWDFTVCQSPQYFMQILASIMCGDINAWRFTVELNIADHYENAKKQIIKSAIGGLEHPHYTESYYVLSQHATANDFAS